MRRGSRKGARLVECCQSICIHISPQEHTHNTNTLTHPHTKPRWDFTRTQQSCRGDKWKPTACVSFTLYLMASLSVGTAWSFIRVMFHTHYQVLFILRRREKLQGNTHLAFVSANLPHKKFKELLDFTHPPPLFSALSWNNLMMMWREVA